MAKGSDGKDGDPTTPGWYPDPWSATGEGERYFDGKHWGSNEKPLARHTVEVTTRDPLKSDRSRRVFLPVVILVVLVLPVWGIPKLLNNDSGSGESVATQRSNDAPPPGADRAAQPLGTPAPVPEGTGKFEVIQHQRGSTTPVAFDPCRPIHYVVNRTGAPSDGLQLVQSAIAKVSTATGLKFIYDGRTSELPNKERESFQPSEYSDQRWAPVLIAFADETSFSELAGYIAGIGSAQAVYAPNNQLVYVTGQVVLDRDQLSAEQAPNRDEVSAVILHELGHLVGLDHTSDRTQLMFSEAQFNVATYGDGDRRGLALLGRQACFPGV